LADDRAAVLLQTMMHDAAPSVRSLAAKVAGRMDRMELVATLIVALRDPDADVRRAAAEAVSRVTGRTIILREPESTIGRAEFDTLKRWWRDKRYTDLARLRGGRGDATDATDTE
jgi:HEAT repeat protein